MSSRKSSLKKSKRFTKKRRVTKSKVRGGGFMDSISSFWSWVTGKGDTKYPTLGEIPSPSSEENKDTDIVIDVDNDISTQNETASESANQDEANHQDTELQPIEEVSDESLPNSDTAIEKDTPSEINDKPMTDPLIEESDMSNKPDQIIENTSEVDTPLKEEDIPVKEADGKKDNAEEKTEKPLSVLGGKKRRKTKRNKNRRQKTRRN